MKAVRCSFISFIICFIMILFSPSVPLSADIEDPAIDNLSKISSEEDLWNQVKMINTLTSYYHYIRKYKTGKHFNEAQDAAKRLSSALMPISKEDENMIKLFLLHNFQKGFMKVKAEHPQWVMFFRKGDIYAAVRNVEIIVPNGIERLSDINETNVFAVFSDGTELFFVDDPPKKIFIFINQKCWLLNKLW